MKLIVNNFYSKDKKLTNIKLIEISSTDFEDNLIVNSIKINEVPLIKFTDTGVLYIINNLYDKLPINSDECEIILNINDLSEISSEGGGSSPDLQAVLDTGGYAYYEGGSIGASILGGTTYARSVNFYVTNEASTQSSAMGINNSSALFRNDFNTNASQLSINEGIFRVSQKIGTRTTELTIGVDAGGNPKYVLPGRASDNVFTIATLEDIYAVGALIPTYADNAAAVTGGLILHGLYKTASGEIRVRV